MAKIILGVLSLVLVCVAQASAVMVQIDPSLNTQSFTSSTDFKTSASDVVAIGIHNNGSNGPIRSFTGFDLSSLPVSPYLQITSATFSFNTQTNAGNLTNASLVMASLNTPFVMSSPNLSWTSINGSNNWTTPGGDVGNVLGTLSPVWANNSAYMFGSTPNFVQAVQNAYNASIPLQVLLYMPAHEAAFPVPSTGGGFIRIHARNNLTLGGTLTLNYEIVLPTPAPEPSTAILACVGIALVSLRSRRSRPVQLN